MDKAWYINGEEKRKIDAYELTQAEYHDIYKGYLYCKTDGCVAEMELVEQDKKNYLRFFRKAKGSKHSDFCKLVDGEDVDGVNGTQSNGVGVGLSDKHSKDILDDVYKIATGTKKPRTPRGKDTGKDKTKKVDKNKDKDKDKTTYTALPTSTRSKNVVEREPPVHRKDVASFLISKNKCTYAVFGEIIDIKIMDDEAYIMISDGKTSQLKICFRNAFVRNNESDFKALKFVEMYNNKKVGKVNCTCICFREEIGSEIIGDVLESDKIRFDNMGIMHIRNIVVREME